MYSIVCDASLIASYYASSKLSSGGYSYVALVLALVCRSSKLKWKPCLPNTLYPGESCILCKDCVLSCIRFVVVVKGPLR